MADDLPFTFAVTEATGSHVTVALSGELDLLGAPALEQELRRHLGCDITVVMRDVTFFDSTALQSLLRIYTESDRGGGTVRVIDPSDTVARVLTIAGVASRLLAD